MKALRLSESSSRNQGKVLLFSPRRDMLAWAKISDLVTVDMRSQGGLLLEDLMKIE